MKYILGGMCCGKFMSQERTNSVRDHALNRHFVMAGAAFDFDVALRRYETVAAAVFRGM